METMSNRRTADFIAIALLSAGALMLARQPVAVQRNAATAPDTGEPAGSPAEIPARGWWAVLKRIVRQFNEHRLMYEAASVIFFVLLAVFPALAALVSLYGFFADPKTMADHLTMLASVMPGGSMDILKEQMARVAANGSGRLGFGLVFGLVVSLWSANQGMKALFNVLNVAYGEEETRSYVRLTLVTLAFTLASLVFALLAIAVVVVVPAALQFAHLDGEGAPLISLLRWPVMLVVVTLFLSAIYRYGPSRSHARWQWVTWGGAFAAVAWVIVSLAFAYYVSRFGTYNRTYGSLGAVIGFMTWIWFSVMVVLLGAELNAELVRQAALDTAQATARPRRTGVAGPAVTGVMDPRAVG
jgi:membrane protein